MPIPFVALLSAIATGRATALDGDVPWIVPPELSKLSEAQSDAAADTAQTLALRDVELDWYKVLGYRALIYSNESFNPATEVSSRGVAVFFGDVQRHPYLETTFGLAGRGCGLERGAEAHCLQVIEGASWAGADLTAIVAVGNGTRGAVFAAYAFAEHVLGVTPFYRFTDDQPTWTGSATAPAAPMAWGPPRFTHRCIFMNDEELLGFFRRDPLGEQIFDAATLDMILEALLRAKGNCAVVGTTHYPDDRSLKPAARRGRASGGARGGTPGRAGRWSTRSGSCATRRRGRPLRGLWPPACSVGGRPPSSQRS